jgi:hypothetical protein
MYESSRQNCETGATDTTLTPIVAVPDEVAVVSPAAPAVALSQTM